MSYKIKCSSLYMWCGGETRTGHVRWQDIEYAPAALRRKITLVDDVWDDAYHADGMGSDSLATVATLADVRELIDWLDDQPVCAESGKISGPNYSPVKIRDKRTVGALARIAARKAVRSASAQGAQS